MDNNVQLTPAMYQVLNELNFQQEDLDKPDFSPVDFINKEFPDEQSLVNLDTVITKLRIRISQYDTEIAQEVRHLSRVGDKASDDLETAQKSIFQLFDKIHQIKEKADKSEQMVQEICSGIKSLDYAKKNITTTITGLKRIHMLVTGVDQLREWTAKRQYKEVGNILEAVNQLSAHFSKEEKYKKIPRIVSLTHAVEDIKNELKGKVHEEFFDKKDAQLPSSQLADVCFVIDSLGAATKEEFKLDFCTNQMQEFKRVFKTSDDSYRLEFSERRFAWAQRKLREHEQRFGEVFPPSWNMSELLCEQFAIKTREHFAEILQKESVDVKVLIHAIRETLKWEKEMCQRFGKQVIIDNTQEFNEKQDEAEDADEDEQSAAAIAKRYRKFQQERDRLNNLSQPVFQIETKFKGIISSVFDRYMGIYVKEEDAIMSQKFDSIVREESWEVDDNASNKILTSSTELTFYFKKTMKRCTELTTNEAFFSLFKLYKKYFQAYSVFLTKKIPAGNENRVELNEKDERTICLIINTSEYCGGLCKQLVATVKASIDEEFKPVVDMKKEQQEFSGVVAKALKVLIAGLITKVADALVALNKMPWGSWQSVTDVSDYVNQFSTYLSQTVPLYNDWLAAIHSRFFCDSFVGAFVPVLVNYIYKCRQISEIGAEQILLDITAMKEALIQLPTLTNKRGPPPTVPARYSKYVTKEMGKAEKILKVILCPPDPSLIALTFVQILPKGTEQLLTRLLDIKGISKSDQQVSIQTYRKAKEPPAKK